MSRRTLDILASILLTTAILSAGLLHNALPHSHSATVISDQHQHQHGEEEQSSPVWTSLHSAIRHEDKKLLFALFSIFSLAIIAVLRIDSGSLAEKIAFSAQHLQERTLRPFDIIAGRWLSHGISPYRKFG